MRRLALVVALVAIAALAGCATVLPRFEPDVQAAVVRDEMRVLETARLVLYYPAPRRAEAARVAARLEACVAKLEAQAPVHNGLARARYHVVLPEVPFNNAYVFPKALGIEDVAVIPTGDTLDFVTEFGLPPDPGMTGCHELTHYVHLRQIAGFWRVLDTVFGDVATPQGGFDPWFLEGLATTYEARLLPGVGRPRWPVFTSMFHAAYAGGAGLRGDALSEYGRMATPGHHYLVGAMFVGWLLDTYGEDALWRLIGAQATSASIVLGVDGRFDDVYGKGLDALVAEFRRHVAKRFPRRARPAGEAIVRRLGTDSRWAWAPDGSTAIVDEDVDRPPRLTVRNPDGSRIAEIKLVEIGPRPALVMGGALLTTGLGFTADSRALYLTALDLGATTQTTRLFRLDLDGDGRLVEVARDLGSGGAIAPDGGTYYALASDGDRWSLIAYDLVTRQRRTVWAAAPGQYALRVAVAPDGRQLAVSVWDGARWAIWLVDAASGARLAELTGAAGGPVYDAAFTPDGRVVFLDDVDGRFQVVVASGAGARAVVTDAPYGALEPRVRGDRLRFLARDGWRSTLDEVALPPADAPALLPPAAAAPPPPFTPIDPPARVVADRAYSRLDGLLVPRLRAPTLLATTGSTAVGVALAGGDRLGYLRWGGAAYVDTATRQVSGALTIVEASLAPWQVVASGQRLAYREAIEVDPMTTRSERHDDRGVALTVGRSWRAGPWLWLTALGEDRRVDDARAGGVGGQVAVGTTGAERTVVGGVRRRVTLAADLTMMRWLRDDFPGDPPGHRVMVGARLDATAPLGRRLAIDLDLRARAAEDGFQLGGVEPATALWARPTPDDDAAIRTPAAIAAIERVRGFEALGGRTDVALIGELAWRYPLVIDRGITHLGFLPATFVRQLDLELFGSAVSDLRDWGYAGGGALTLRLALFRAPLALRYQASRTWLDDRWSTTQVLTLGADL
ncbi:MAG: hypothetical protein IPH44_27970 [Myxococcales bacterium]|nr:hypothetical protein [Myxococcales bacterium]MBK7196162.1 hypothetical protein [Myxococcales bacterium]MBP6845809.1 hypothetical protein [Kofleriaceae bacterium]